MYIDKTIKTCWTSFRGGKTVKTAVKSRKIKELSPYAKQCTVHSCLIVVFVIRWSRLFKATKKSTESETMGNSKPS